MPKTTSPETRVRYVLFDAVGTVLRPKPSVGDTYYAAGVVAGSRLPRDEVTRRFRREFQREFGAERAAAATCEELERVRWRNVVRQVFDDVRDVDEYLFPRLWDHFGEGRNWQLFDDAPAAWQALDRAGFGLGLASNFDARLLDICRSVPLLADCPRIFASSEVGWVKPAREFYVTVQRRLGCAPEQIVLVGDDYWNDYRGALDAGWHAIWLTRDHAPPAVGDSSVDGIESLHELPARLGITA